MRNHLSPPRFETRPDPQYQIVHFTSASLIVDPAQRQFVTQACMLRRQGRIGTMRTWLYGRCAAERALCIVHFTSARLSLTQLNGGS